MAEELNQIEVDQGAPVPVSPVEEMRGVGGQGEAFGQGTDFLGAVEGAAVGGMARSRAAVSAVVDTLGIREEHLWWLNPILGARVDKTEFEDYAGDRALKWYEGMRRGEMQRKVAQYDIEYVRNQARARGLTSWYGDLAAGFAGAFFTDPAQIVGIGASRFLVGAVRTLAVTRFAQQAQWLAGTSLKAGAGRFALTIAPEIYFEKQLAGYTRGEYGVTDAAMDVAGELLLEGVISGVDLGREAFANRKSFARNIRKSIEAKRASKASEQASRESKLATIKETLDEAKAAPDADVTPLVVGEEIPDGETPPLDAYNLDVEAENQSIYNDPQPGVEAEFMQEDAAVLAESAKDHPRRKIPEEPIEVIVAHTALINEGMIVTPDEIKAEFAKADEVLNTSPGVKVEAPDMEMGPERADPPPAVESDPDEDAADEETAAVVAFAEELLAVSSEFDSFKRDNPKDTWKGEKWTPEQEAEWQRLVDKRKEILARRERYFDDIDNKADAASPNPPTKKEIQTKLKAAEKKKNKADAALEKAKKELDELSNKKNVSVEDRDRAIAKTSRAETEAEKAAAEMYEIRNIHDRLERTESRAKQDKKIKKIKKIKQINNSLSQEITVLPAGLHAHTTIEASVEEVLESQQSFEEMLEKLPKERADAERARMEKDQKAFRTAVEEAVKCSKVGAK